MEDKELKDKIKYKALKDVFVLTEDWTKESDKTFKDLQEYLMNK